MVICFPCTYACSHCQVSTNTSNVQCTRTIDDIHMGVVMLMPILLDCVFIEIFNAEVLFREDSTAGKSFSTHVSNDYKCQVVTKGILVCIL